MSVKVIPSYIPTAAFSSKGILRFKRATPTRQMKRQTNNKRTNILTVINNIK